MGRRNCGGVLVVDGDEDVRYELSALLTRAGFAVVSVSSGTEALRAVEDSLPGVVLLNVFLPDISGYEVCRALRDEFGADLPIVFISRDRTEPSDRVAGLLLGADDYICAPFDAGELIARLRRFARRDEISVRSTRPSIPPGPRLTERELQVLQLLGRGFRTSDIAAELVISPRTVASHVHGILSKLMVKSQTQAVAAAYREGLLDVRADPEASLVADSHSTG